MPELADILRAKAPEYMAKYGQKMLPSHKRAIEDIILCRTPPLGGNVYRCEPCDEYRYSYHSCKNRSCPKCGNDEATKWLAAQQALLLPVPYFLVTSTLPEELRPAAGSNQKLIYGLLLHLTAKAVQKLARDPKWLGGEIGLLGVAQTWARERCVITAFSVHENESCSMLSKNYLVSSNHKMKSLVRIATLLLKCA